jgi:hypothetical protein
MTSLFRGGNHDARTRLGPVGVRPSAEFASARRRRMGDMMQYLFIALKSGCLPLRLAWDWLPHTEPPEANTAVSSLWSVISSPPLRFVVFHR